MRSCTLAPCFTFDDAHYQSESIVKLTYCPCWQHTQAELTIPASDMGKGESGVNRNVFGLQLQRVTLAPLVHSRSILGAAH